MISQYFVNKPWIPVCAAAVCKLFWQNSQLKLIAPKWFYCLFWNYIWNITVQFQRLYTDFVRHLFDIWSIDLIGFTSFVAVYIVVLKHFTFSFLSFILTKLNLTFRLDWLVQQIERRFLILISSYKLDWSYFTLFIFHTRCIYI